MTTKLIIHKKSIERWYHRLKAERPCESLHRTKRIWPTHSFSDREKSIDELIEWFRAYKADQNSLATLQNNMIRARTALAKPALHRTKEMIISVNGRYYATRYAQISGCKTFEALSKNTRSESFSEKTMRESIDFFAVAAVLHAEITQFESLPSSIGPL